MAIHYYDEQRSVGKPISGQVVVNHVITEEEKAAMKQKSNLDLVSDEKRRLTQKKSDYYQSVEVQGSLFKSHNHETN
jgi:hypothetical protein